MTARHPLDDPREPVEPQPEATPDADGDVGPDHTDDGEPGAAPSWWHRDHPTFTALSGFFTGLAFIIVVPGTFAALLSAFFDTGTAEDLFPFVVLTLAVPLGLLVAPRTRRFGRYMVLGIVTTLLVVGGVAALVLWLLVSLEG
ncbi:hypothetical protein [Nocardioides lijunqiniae]|uniref:hypothetical protein n=1 Tax=Nocardioides lijunqiniae TaxID=2760832 RepID=UPI001877F4B5|nr:hypothetical protein [Nocardioides lijunqiniae]